MVTILLIEDNPGDAVIFREKLNASDLEYKLATAKRLGEGLERIGETSFDIILVDLSLPDAQGLEAVSRVREAAPDRPLIVLTGLDDATAAAEAKEQGAVDYLVKWYVDSVSLARYIRYAIAQYKMFEGGHADVDGAGARPQRPQTQEVGGRVVEGEIVRRPESDETETDVEEEPPRAQPTGERRAQNEERETRTTDGSGERNGQRSDPLAGALNNSSAALLVATADGTVRYATEAARRWVPNDDYPWSVSASGPVESGEVKLQQSVSSTTWSGEEAYLIHLQRREGEQLATGQTESSDARMLRETSEAALAFAEHTVLRNQWMADVLRSALDLHRVVAGEVDVKHEDIDILDLAQRVVRDRRSLAMSYGLPLRVTSDRKKAIAYADRNLVTALLNRLLTDAVHTAGPDGVEANVEVDKKYTVVHVGWDERVRDAEPATEACVGLGWRLVRHLASLSDGDAEHERHRSGHHTFTVRFPCRTAE